MTAWKNLPEPKPDWETFKELLYQFWTVDKAMASWHEEYKKRNTIK